MPFKEHPTCKTPDQDIRIWRYMSYAKFLSLLQRRALFFCRMSELAEKDPFEGHYPRVTADRIAEGERQVTEAYASRLGERYGVAFAREYLEMRREAPDGREHFRETICVNCWHVSQHESSAMWQLYVPEREGVAVVSSFKCLCDSFAELPNDVHIGLVGYLDYQKDELHMPDALHPAVGNALHPLLHKRLGFEHERELRAMTYDIGSLPESMLEQLNLQDRLLERTDKGVFVPTEFATLVQQVYIVPSALDGVENKVKQVMKHYGVKTPVIPSELDRGPPW